VASRLLARRVNQLPLFIFDKVLELLGGDNLRLILLSAMGLPVSSLKTEVFPTLFAPKSTAVFTIFQI